MYGLCVDANPDRGPVGFMAVLDGILDEIGQKSTNFVRISSEPTLAVYQLTQVGRDVARPWVATCS